MPLGLALLAFAAGCGGAADYSQGPGGELEPPVHFAISPVPLDSLSIIALGWLSPPPHTLPSDHMYLVKGTATGPGMGQLHAEIVAPVGGTIVSIIARFPGDSKVMISVTPSFRYYFDHMSLDPALHVGSSFATGARLGTTGPNGGADFGVVNEAHENAFAAPARYGPDTRHADSPLHYFDGPLRSLLEARVLRVGNDKDGAIAQDVPGTLAGAWFLATLPLDQTSTGPDGWPKQLAFVADPLEPSIPRVSIGGQLGLTGVWTVNAGDPAFAQVTPASGLVRYRLAVIDPNYPERGQRTVGILLVQLTAPEQLRVEAFPDAIQATGFTAAALDYRR